jgi:2-amino-4-hydroxy-6-hydroxymethyldihydropteridine diphosphokinase
MKIDGPDDSERITLKPMHTAYIALGANLDSWAGPPATTLARAAERLQTPGRVKRRSSLYSTEPVGFAEQPRFVNAVLALEPHALLKKLLSIEKEFGRDRTTGILNGPRTLDLDILLVDNLEVNEPGLELPHPRLAERAFVLVPLNEIAPQLTIAGRGKTVAELLKSLQSSCKDAADAVVRMESNDWHTAGWR